MTGSRAPRPPAVAARIRRWAGIAVDAIAALAVIAATIHVERSSQKGIIIGARASRLKAIGIAARQELERLLDRRIHLELFVRVQEGWTAREAMLREFGI